MRSRIAAVLTVIGLVAGSGGALAVAGGSSGGSASVAQYCHKKDKERGKCDKGKDKRHDDKKKHCKKGEEKKNHKCDRRKPDKKHDK
jgi:hypothetical protein